jgi:hypothetical protein
VIEELSEIAEISRCSDGIDDPDHPDDPDDADRPDRDEYWRGLTTLIKCAGRPCERIKGAKYPCDSHQFIKTSLLQ